MRCGFARSRSGLGRVRNSERAMADALELPCTVATLASALGLSPTQLLNVYVGGSRLWQTSSSSSDYDIYVIHAQKDAALRLKTLSVNIAGAKFDATVMHRDEWADRLRRHKPVDVAVTAFNPRPAQQKLTPAQGPSVVSHAGVAARRQVSFVPSDQVDSRALAPRVVVALEHGRADVG